MQPVSPARASPPCSPRRPPWSGAEGPVDGDGQRQQLRTVQVVDRRLRLLAGLVLHQRVALQAAGGGRGVGGERGREGRGERRCGESPPWPMRLQMRCGKRWLCGDESTANDACGSQWAIHMDVV